MWGEQFLGKTVLVTGGGGGIGLETARTFAIAGANVAVSGRDESRLSQAVSELQSLGARAIAVRANVAISDDVSNMVSRTAESFGGLHILVNNAGIGPSGKLLCDISESDFDEVLAVDAKGVWLCMKYAIPTIIGSGGGAVVNVASKNGILGTSNTLEYTAAKHAVVGMTRTAAIEYGRQGVRVNCICPAAHASEMGLRFKASFAPEAWEARMAAAYPATGRLGTLAEAAGTIAFLCSEAASNIHGVALPVDGGFSAQ